MHKNIIWVLLVVFSLFLLAGCETETCRSACGRIYGAGTDQCGMPPMQNCDTAGVSSVDCGDPAAWADYQKGQCISDCEDAMYTLTELEDESDTRRSLYNEEDAVQFVTCVVNHPLDSCKTDYWVACDGIIW